MAYDDKHKLPDEPEQAEKKKWWKRSMKMGRPSLSSILIFMAAMVGAMAALMSVMMVQIYGLAPKVLSTASSTVTQLQTFINSAQDVTQKMQITQTELSQRLDNTAANMNKAIADGVAAATADRVKLIGTEARLSNMASAMAESVDRFNDASKSLAVQAHQDQEGLEKIISVNAQTEDARLSAIQQNTAKIADATYRTAASNDLMVRYLKEAEERLRLANQSVQTPVETPKPLVREQSPPPLPTAEQLAKEREGQSASPPSTISVTNENVSDNKCRRQKYDGIEWRVTSIPAGGRTKAYKAKEAKAGKISLSGDPGIHAALIYKIGFVREWTKDVDIGARKSFSIQGADEVVFYDPVHSFEVWEKE